MVQVQESLMEYYDKTEAVSSVSSVTCTLVIVDGAFGGLPQIQFIMENDVSNHVRTLCTRQPGSAPTTGYNKEQDTTNRNVQGSGMIREITAL